MELEWTSEQAQAELELCLGLVARQIDKVFEPGNLIAFDCETTGLHAWIGELPFSVAICNANFDVWYCEWPVDPFTRKVTPNPKDVAYIKSILEDPSITKIGHNLKFDVRMLELGCGIHTVGPIQETYFAARACNSLEREYGLKYLSDKYLGIPKEDQDRLVQAVHHYRKCGRNLGYLLGESVYQDYWLPKVFDPANTLCQEYCELDAARTMGLWLKCYSEGLLQENVEQLYQQEIDLWWPTYHMESRGVRINVDIVKEEHARHTITVADAEEKMNQLAKESLTRYLGDLEAAWAFEFEGTTAERSTSWALIESGKNLKTLSVGDAKIAKIRKWLAMEPFVINPNSAAQCLLVCEARNIQPSEYTQDGEGDTLSMSFNSIRKIADDPFIYQLQRFRASQKVRNTFLEKYLMHAVDDPYIPGGMCLHPMFNQAAAQTGRFGCSHPNLQQVVNANGARNAVEAMSARMAFGPRPGWVWYHFDYSQLELYLFASLAGEKFMLHHIMSGHDMHSECANKAWGGKGNPAALIKGMVALECEADKPTTEDVERVWKEYGWDTRYRLDRKAKEDFTSWWLDTYGGDNWDIVKAEKALGKKVARTRAKFVMYAKIYGGGPKAIKNFLYCTDAEAKEFQLEYDTAFPRIKQYLREMCRRAERDGFVINPYGRKVGIPEGYPYKVVNFLVQSSAADLLKASMRSTGPYAREVGAEMVLTIHDELVFEFPLVGEQPEFHEKVKSDGTTDRWYDFPRPSALQMDLRTIQSLMEDHGGRFSVPTPVECARCDHRWDVKINVNM